MCFRRYRRSLQLAQVAAQDFQKQSARFAIHLGDIVDGVQSSVANEHGGVKSAVLYALEQALAAFGRFTAGTTYHVLGNHCLYCYSRRHLQKRLDMNGPGDRCYYSFLPHPKLRMIVLDTYDVAVIGNASSSKEYQEASALLDEHGVRSHPLLLNSAMVASFRFEHRAHLRLATLSRSWISQHTRLIPSGGGCTSTELSAKPS